MTAVAAATAAPLVPKWYSAPPCPGCIPLPDLGWNSIKSPWKEKKIGEKVEKKRGEFCFLSSRPREAGNEGGGIDRRER